MTGLTRIDQPSPKWRGLVRHTKFWSSAVRTLRWPGHQLFRIVLNLVCRGWRSIGISVLRWMRVRASDLYKAFRADRLIAASCFVEMWWVVEKADWTLKCILVKIRLNLLAVDVGIIGQLDFTSS